MAYLIKIDQLLTRLRDEIYDQRGDGPGLRFTQDTPILPDVWEEFAKRPAGQIDLLISPFRGEKAGIVAKDLKHALEQYEKARNRSISKKDGEFDRAPPRIAHIPGLIVASVYFEHLVALILPSTRWWGGRLAQMRKAWSQSKLDNEEDKDKLRWPDVDDDHLDDVKEWMEERWGKFQKFSRSNRWSHIEDKTVASQAVLEPPYDLLKIIRIVGMIELSNRAQLKEGKLQESDETEQAEPTDLPSSAGLVDAFNDLFKFRKGQSLKTFQCLWGATLNRAGNSVVQRSTKAMKADAGRRLFNITGNGQRWAIFDSGIDGSHPAFSDWRRRDVPELSPAELPRRLTNTLFDERPTRVVRTYDFDGLRELLDSDLLDQMCDDLKAITKKQRGASERAFERVKEAEEAFSKCVSELFEQRQQGARFSEIDKAQRALRNARETRAKALCVRRLIAAAKFRHEQIFYQRSISRGYDVTEELDVVSGLSKRLKEGLDVDWNAVETLIEDVHPPLPPDNHGTNVAAILGANWIERLKDNYSKDKDGVYPARRHDDGHARMLGVCPDIELVDCRIISETEDGRLAPHDFEVIAAAKFINHVNSRSDKISIHGANLSIAIEHNVRSFACGRTPVCEECERLVSGGVTVVAAAGNSGYCEASDISERFYRPASIADPGNAEGVITVGATHRHKPHEYGVSYFSSRGPTGDGRAKPDMVAPGEKIRTAAPRASETVVDGTSFASPHVAGAAALLMDRHTELIGQPQRIKKILCASATDLGRERDFQGCGMLDILRALQSI